MRWQRAWQRLIKQHNVFNDGFLPTRQYLHRIARGNAARCDGTGETAKIRVGPINPVYGQPKVSIQVVRSNFNAFQIAQQRRAAVPRRAPRALDNVVTLQRRQRYGRDAFEAQRRCKGQIVGFDLREHARIVIHQIHFIDRQHHMGNTQQRGQK